MLAIKLKFRSRSWVLGATFALIAAGLALSGFAAIGLAYFIATLPLVVRG